MFSAAKKLLILLFMNETLVTIPGPVLPVEAEAKKCFECRMCQLLHLNSEEADMLAARNDIMMFQLTCRGSKGKDNKFLTSLKKPQSHRKRSHEKSVNYTRILDLLPER